MISYWKNYKDIHIDDGLVLIIGWYDHKNKHGGGEKSLGVHWGDYPQSRGVLSPCVIPQATRNAILSGLLCQVASSGNKALIKSITEAIDFFLMHKPNKKIKRTAKSVTNFGVRQYVF